jgi:4-diphosphocytidyl-2-C-methyl-D-erythritol kinase
MNRARKLNEERVPEELVEQARAKLNLFLEVRGKREDGYHNIRSFVSEISLSDNLTFRLTTSGSIKIFCSQPELSNDANIISQIAQFLQKRYGVEKGIDIYIEKNIPVAAGLGGGSSNAAVAIKALNELWGLNLSFKEMHYIAGRFGSDINFFIESGQALIYGRGEKVKPLSIPVKMEYLLLVNPSIQISSKYAYSLISCYTEQDEKFKKMCKALQAGDIKMISGSLYNDLEQGVMSRYSLLREIKQALLDLGALGSLMSGSGATIFGIFDSENKLMRAEKHFSELNFWTYAAQTL